MQLSSIPKGESPFYFYFGKWVYFIPSASVLLERHLKGYLVTVFGGLLLPDQGTIINGQYSVTASTK